MMLKAKQIPSPIAAAGKEGILLERRMPENVCQIGRTNSSQKIYVEDYVISFLKEILKDMRHGAADKSVLLLFYGNGFERDGVRCFFLEGMAVRAGAGKNGFLSEEQKAFERIGHRFFSEKKAVGWYCLMPGETSILEVFQNMKEQNFSGIQGYYIYYEKNAAMEEYLIQYHRKKREPEPLPDKINKKEHSKAGAGRPVRKRIRKSDKQEPVVCGIMTPAVSVRVMNAVSLCILIICCIIAVTTLNQYDKMKRLEQTVICLEESMREQNYELQDQSEPDR